MDNNNKRLMCDTCIYKNNSFKMNDRVFSRFYEPGEIGDVDAIECSKIMRIRAMCNIMFGDFNDLRCCLYREREKEITFEEGSISIEKTTT